MAEERGHSRSEAPTLRRREEARKQGQVALSTDLSSSLMLLAAVFWLWLAARQLAGGLLRDVRADLAGIYRSDFGSEQAQALCLSLLARGGTLLGAFLAVMVVAGLAVNLLQVGFYVAPGLIAPKWSRVSPAAGWSRLVSGAAWMRGLISLLKLAAVAATAVWVLHARVWQIGGLGQGDLATAAAGAWDIVLRLVLAVAAALVLIGLADYAFQRWRHEQSLKMSREEIREELKREEGDPMIRARIRKLGRELIRRRMMEDVPKASVVITNPTHLAVALQYERGRMNAPRVVAKGAGFVALRIIELARRHAVPVVERKPVAQALYKATQVGQEIPAALYYAVAEVLAYVYRLRGAA
jgi:flagellar biosynthetic protein FlhB